MKDSEAIAAVNEELVKMFTEDWAPEILLDRGPGDPVVCFNYAGSMAVGMVKLKKELVSGTLDEFIRHEVRTTLMKMVAMIQKKVDEIGNMDDY